MKEEIFRARLSTKGQLVIPKPLRNAYRLREGENLVLVPAEAGVLVKPATESNSKSLRGLLAKKDVSIEECEDILNSARKSLLRTRA